MKTAILILAATALFVGLAGTGVAPSVCVNVGTSLDALVSFVTDPNPDLLALPVLIVDIVPVCP